MEQTIGILNSEPIKIHSLDDAIYYKGRPVELNLTEGMNKRYNRNLMNEVYEGWKPKIEVNKIGLPSRSIVALYGERLDEAVVHIALMHQVPLEKAKEMFYKKVLKLKNLQDEKERARCEKIRQSALLQRQYQILRDVSYTLVKGNPVLAFKSLQEQFEITRQEIEKLQESLEERVERMQEKIGVLRGRQVHVKVIKFRWGPETVTSILYNKKAISVYPGILNREYAEFLIAYQRTDFKKAKDDFNKDRYWHLGRNKIESVEID